jgi:zinc D-Ala-D-Ala carboxypeptidase
MTHFKPEEFACRHCGKNEMDSEFLHKLDIARELAGVPFFINSGYRCPLHNKAVGSTSANHTSGKAADIACENSFVRTKILTALILAGFRRIGIAKSFIHVDSMDGEALWLY